MNSTQVSYSDDTLDGWVGMGTFIGTPHTLTPDSGPSPFTPFTFTLTQADVSRMLAITILHETIWHKSNGFGEGESNMNNARLPSGVHIGINQWCNIIPYGFVVPAVPGGPAPLPVPMDDEQIYHLARQLGYITE